MDVVRDSLAMQSQDYGPAKWAIAQRSPGLSETDIDEAVAAGSILRTHVLRPTWHFVAREDIRWLLQATAPRIAKGIAPRLRELGLDDQTLTEAEEKVDNVLEGDRHLTRADLAEELRSQGIDTLGQRLPYILMHCELTGLICSGRPEGNKQTFALLSDRTARGTSVETDEGKRELVRRYLEGHGPATVNDLRWWSSLTVSDIKGALEALGPEVATGTVEGLTLWWLADAEEPQVPEGARLLQTYDEFVVGYRDSRFIGDPRGPQAIAAWKDRAMPGGIVLIDGAIAGHWRRKLELRRVVAQVFVYEPMKAATRSALEEETARLGSFLDRPVHLEVAAL